MRTTACLLVLSSTLFAQSIVVPNANATVPGTSGLNTIIRNAGNPRTYQYGVNAAELAGIPIGSVITGVSVRLYVSGVSIPAWPPADISWTTYDIWVGPANPVAGWVGNPMLNYSSPPQQVRTGPMTLDGGVFADLATPGMPNPWAEFYFDFQVPYLYLGGDLALLFSHPGSNDPTAPQFPDVVAPNPATHGVSFSQAVQGGTAMVSASFYVMRLHYGYGAGCPSTAGKVPVLVQNADLTGGAGGNILLQIANAAPGSLAVCAFGFTQLNVPIGGGCNLLVSPDVLVFAGITNSHGRVVVSVPVAPGAVGNFFAQGAVLDAGLPLGFCVSNGAAPSAN
ncbi:MAG TPA: hypothetical protein VFZ65_01055 [Planctomycetota bacterium]|nr:hypothetical protein [Planctomycetota bacterium]